jgi:hypothetical protein
MLTCCTWINVHPDPSDVWLAVGGRDGIVRLLSITRSAEFRRLSAATGKIDDNLLKEQPLNYADI